MWLAGAGNDACESMRRDKLSFYAPYEAEMGREGLTYRPLTFSSYGRVHPEAADILQLMAQRAARRRGLGSHALILRRAHVRIGVELARRAARMVAACLPQPTAAEAALLFGPDPAAGPATEGAEDGEAEVDEGDVLGSARGLVLYGGTADLAA